MDKDKATDHLTLTKNLDPFAVFRAMYFDKEKRQETI
jgi:hypothetical protein